MTVIGKKIHRRNFFALASASALAGFCGCRSVPMTGRKQMVFIPEGKEISLGIQAFEETLTEQPKSQNTAAVEMVNRVGDRIARVANRPDYQWEFVLLQSKEQNAFCLPGGKVAVHEGILPVCNNEAGLAVVMSHEVAHALARHGGERMSQGMAVNGVKQAVDMVTTAKLPDKKAIILKAYGVASEIGYVLPYSRKQESEADEIGIMLMAQAGYDPQEAPRFWERFGSAKGSAKTPEFLSTHPSDARRAENLANLVGAAVENYRRAPIQYGNGQPI
jgi:metalloendopeptidase OMA1, mitochondrial